MRIQIRQFCVSVSVLAVILSDSVAHGADNDKHKTVTNSIDMKLMLIPAGEFKMGTAESDDDLNKAFPDATKEDKEKFDDERPRHRVRITKDFYLSRTNVTLAQFRDFVNDTHYKTEAEKDDKGGWGYDPEDKDEPFSQSTDYTWREWGFDQGDEHPVVNVSWNDAVEFCKWLGKKEGKTYRLPTEAEFEYACRAGTNTRYYNGDDPEGLAKIGNVLDQSLLKKIGDKFREENEKAAIKANDRYPFTSPGGRFEPNAFGLYDMHGNAASWCSDWYSEDYYLNAPTFSEDPTGPPAGSQRVFRGGSWNSDAVDARAASRDADEPSARSFDIGFRVVLEK